MSALAALALLSALPRHDASIDVLFSPTGEKRLLEDRIAAEIRGAEREVRVAMFHFTSERLVRALAERRRAGAAVAVLVDAAQCDEDALSRLRAAKLDVRRVVPREEGARFHHKFCVLDSKAVITGSYNWTVLADVASHENVMVVRHDGAARAYRDEFDRIWKDKDLSRP